MFTKNHMGSDPRLWTLPAVIALTLGLAWLSLGQFSALAQSASGDRSSGPSTYLELYLETYECGLYFAYITKGLHQVGASEESVEFYADKAGTAPWALSALGEAMSPADQRGALKQASSLERQFKKKTGRGYGKLDAIKAEYDARCIQALDSFDATAAAIRRRLELQSGDPFAALRRQCVTVSTDRLTATGEYMGMIGPSVKDVRTSGLRPVPSPKPGDILQIRLPHGTVAEREAMPIPDPPEAHIRLLAASGADQAKVLGEAVQERLAGIKVWGACSEPVKPYFRGLDHLGKARWAVTCLDGESWPIEIDHEGRFWVTTPCPTGSEGDEPDCYEPCRGRGCFTKRRYVDSTMEYLSYTDSVRVVAAPAERCAEMWGGISYNNQGGPPSHEGGRLVAVSVVDPMKCEAIINGVQRLTIQISGEKKLDVLYVDIGSLRLPGFVLDMPGGPPCELLHGNATVDRYADLRCRFVIAEPATPAARIPLTLSGSFINGARFEGSFESCVP